MKTFHHVFVMCVVVFLAWEAAAVEETVQFNTAPVFVFDADNQRQTVESWTIEVKRVESESAYLSRRNDNEGKELAVFFFNNDALKGDDGKFKVLAAKEFAKNGVENGVYLIVPKGVLSDDLKNKEKIGSKNYLWFDLEDKHKVVDVTDKASYDARHNQYKGRSIFTLFLDYEPDCVTESGQNCLEKRKEDTMIWLRDRFKAMCVRTVLLVAKVKDVGDDVTEKLCPHLGKPSQYPALYHEKNSKLIEIIGFISSNGRKANYIAKDTC
ncbi:uncharacterized protein LOC128993936 [Macrosteles quadrilineatus]|uniref:uncharacterized protein LOC128993936 n=1 Tax=Macrosteles quadrilineatus TaxID=74068 RepID=UPI0023E128EE|nr:uncharacterized protein LOC128993936 [Macrosteles quadrilineatus]